MKAKDILQSACGRLNSHLAEDAVPKKLKYNNVKTTLDGITFDSQKEADRYVSLRALQAAGQITNLQCQVPFRLHIEGEKIADYIADFTYKDQDGQMVVEDVKSKITRKLPVYRLKKKLMAAIYKIEIKEV